jgi:hypothetical protein
MRYAGTYAGWWDGWVEEGSIVIGLHITPSAEKGQNKALEKNFIIFF